MKIGDEVYVHGYVDEIRKDVVIVRNEGGYFGTVPSEVIDIVRCKECVHKGVDADDEPYCELHNMGIYADDYCSYGEREDE